MAPQVQSMNPADANQLARAMVISQSVERVQQIFSQTLPFSQINGPINVQPRNVGLIKGFFVDVTIELTNPGPGTYNITQLGAANALSQIKFDDLQNNTRIQTTGWHCHLVNTVRNQRPWGLAIDYTSISSAINYTATWPVIEADFTLGPASAGSVTMRYYVPMAYSNDDLRGAIYANVVNATMQLGLTVNPNMVAYGTAAQIEAGRNTAIYVGADAPNVGNVSVTVYQHYLDQLPMGNQGPILPMLDLQTIYELKSTSMTGISVDQDYTIPYSNFRTFLSTFAIFDNGNEDQAGSDINYWALESANFTNIIKTSPVEIALLGRLAIGTDLPGPDTYYFSHRNKPINTIQYGNMNLILNAATLNANSPARVLIGYEDFAMINVVSGAGSLPAGG